MSAETPPADEGRMTLREHLEELRSCLIKSTIAVLVLFGVGLSLKSRLLDVILLPWNMARESIVAGGGTDPGVLLQIEPAEQIVFVMKVALAFALVFGSPVYLGQVWKFIVSGLLPHEKKAVQRSFPLALLMFVSGMVFGYLVLLPIGLDFMMTVVGEDQIASGVTVSNYFGLLVSLTLLLGAVFELPLLMWVAVRIGVIERETLAGSRRVAIVCMLIFSSLMTPPDIITQLLVSGPMIVLYELGLLMARKAETARDKEI